MEPAQILILDLEHEPRPALSQLEQALGMEAGTAFQMQRQCLDWRTCLQGHRNLAEDLADLDASLLLLALDRRATPALLTELIEPISAAGAIPFWVLVTPECEACDIRQLLHQGAADVWLTPLRAAEVLARTLHLLQQISPRPEPAIQALKAEHGLAQFVGRSPSLLQAIKQIPKIAQSNANIMICGETGTGKEIAARTIHYLSQRSGGPFITLDCGAIPPELFENELFGHAPGAFTSANGTAVGAVAQANDGTLFLDEIDSLPLQAQPKLLRFLQQLEYRPLGSDKVQHANVRVIAASNANLEECVRVGSFRRDLYYRLVVAEVELPPLRDREGDVDILADHFLRQLAVGTGQRPHTLSAGARRRLKIHSWPGNVRELENILARAVALAKGTQIQAADLSLPTLEIPGRSGTLKALKAEAVAAFERTYLAEVLRAHNGNITQAARAAGKQRSSFWALLRKHRLLPSQAVSAKESTGLRAMGGWGVSQNL
jgi:DNA-binding NtrC family response regulator